MQRAADVAATQLARAQADVRRLSPSKRRSSDRTSRGQRQPSPASSEGSLGQGSLGQGSLGQGSVEDSDDSGASSGGGVAGPPAPVETGSPPPPPDPGDEFLPSPVVSLADIYPPPSPPEGDSPRTRQTHTHS